MAFISNSHDFHWHAHAASKSEARRASNHYLEPSRIRQKIHGRPSTRRLCWRCVCPVFSIEQADHKLKHLSFPAHVVKYLFLYAQNFVRIFHHRPLSWVRSATMPGSQLETGYSILEIGGALLNRKPRGKESTSYDSWSR